MSDTAGLKLRLSDEMKAAMRSKEKERLLTIRLIQAAIKQREVDERVEMDDTQVLVILDKMVKQRRESIAQFSTAGRDDLVAKEQAELEILKEFMPQPLSEAEIDALLEQAIQSVDAKSMQDMGKVMGILKPQLQGRADMGAVSGKIKSRLS